MKKRYFAFVLALALLALCACDTTGPESTSETTSTTQTEPTDLPTTAEAPTAEPTEAPTVSTVQESSFRDAQNWSGAGGQSLTYRIERVQPDSDIQVYFDKLIFEGTFAGVDRINAAIADRCSTYIEMEFEEVAAQLEYYENNGDLETSPQNKNIHSYSELKGAWTDGKYLSIHFYSDTWLGGASNTGDFGVNYDLETGNVSTLADYYRDYDAETVRMNILKSVAEDRGDEISDFSRIDRPLGDLNFYFYDDTVAINFGPYEFGYGGWSRTNEYPIEKFRTNNDLFAE